MRFRDVFFVLILVYGVVGPAYTAPLKYTQQGRLTDSDTRIPFAGTQNLKFSIYDALSGGNQKWTETHEVTFVDGYYSVILGTTTTLDSTVFGSEGRWLEIKVGETQAFSPRQEITSVPYAVFPDAEADAIAANSVKTGITDDQAAAIVANSAKTEITTDQATAIVANTNKTGFPGFGTTAGKALEGNALSDYATQNWVTETALSDYATHNSVSHAIFCGNDHSFLNNGKCAACPGSVPTLVKNDLASWTVAWTLGTAQNVPNWKAYSEGGYDATEGYWGSSYGAFQNCDPRYKHQTINLRDTYSEEQLAQQPAITVGEYAQRQAGSAAKHRLWVGLFKVGETDFGDGDAIAFYDSGPYWANSSWSWKGHTFTDYGQAVQYVRIYSYGCSSEFWTGYYGVQTDAHQVRVSVNPGDTVDSTSYSACNGNGMCSPGDHGDGICTCNEGYSGPNCGISE